MKRLGLSTEDEQSGRKWRRKIKATSRIMAVNPMCICVSVAAIEQSYVLLSMFYQSYQSIDIFIHNRVQREE